MLRFKQTLCLIATAVLGLFILTALGGQLAAEDEPIPTDPISAHVVADAIEFPRLQAAINEWFRFHPQDTDRPFDHAHKLDASKEGQRDRDRVEAIRRQFRRWDKAMKAAGY